MEDVQRELNSFKGKAVSQKASSKDSLKRNRITLIPQKVKDDLKKHDYDMLIPLQRLENKLSNGNMDRIMFISVN